MGPNLTLPCQAHSNVSETKCTVCRLYVFTMVATDQISAVYHDVYVYARLLTALPEGWLFYGVRCQ